MPQPSCAATPQQALTRILGPSGTPIGTGCLTLNGLVVTCAHVVRDALGVHKDEQECLKGVIPKGRVKLTFPFLPGGAGANGHAPPAIFEAEVAPGGWGWMDAISHANDIAILQLVDEAPFVCGRLFSASDHTGSDIAVFVHGFPSRDPNAGPVKGTLMAHGVLEDDRRIFDCKDAAYQFDFGFSGAPVFFDHGAEAAGLFIGAPHYVKGSQREADRIGYVLPASHVMALLDAVLRTAATQGVSAEFVAVGAYIPTVRASLEQLGGAVNSAGPLIEGMERFLGHLEVLGREKLGDANLACLSRMVVNLERRAEMAAERGYDQHLTLFGLRDFCGKLKAVSRKLRPERLDASEACAIPNDPLEEEKLPHWRELEALKADIDKRLEELDRLIPSISSELRLRIRNELLLLRQELDLDPLHLKAIDNARAELEALDHSLFDALIKQCQTLLGVYAEKLPPGSVFRDFPEGPEMVIIPAGKFLMGSPADEPERRSYEGPRHEVTIPKRFAMGRYAVTFDEWLFAVAAGGCDGYEPDDKGWGRGDRPVISVSWEDAQAYVRWLSGKTGKTYRLPSEAEWEYATRAATTGPFSFEGEITTDKANYRGNYSYDGSPVGEWREKTVPVRSFKPNGFGLYQVHGNVYEWCEDVSHDSYKEKPQELKANGGAWTSRNSGDRVVRGGSWGLNPQSLRAANRLGLNPDNRYNDIGFRLARTLNP